ncbi:hypothetical protein BRC83_03645 [Halobacteriales archaeon QS_1_68_17]|nr:MAG: hypothetical protein BRC83_03645 [Halobacteriales archaeon QS_1_68_17]
MGSRRERQGGNEDGDDDGGCGDAVGVVACGTLYSEIEALAPDADVRYVPQELHEFPTNVPLGDEIRARVQAAVDDLDGPDRDRIVLSYATAGEGLRGVRSRHAPLVVSRADDCIATFLPDGPGDPKAFGTYYLTRGWIDRGVDSYKLYRAYLGETDDLREWFAAAADDHPDVRVTWADGDRFRKAVGERGETSPELAGRTFHRTVQYYDRIALIDTGHRYPFHREYAGRVRAFVESLAAEYGDGRSVELSVIEGDDGLLRTLLSVETPADAADADRIAWRAPGEPVDPGRAGDAGESTEPGKSDEPGEATGIEEPGESGEASGPGEPTESRTDGDPND